MLAIAAFLSPTPVRRGRSCLPEGEIVRNAGRSAMMSPCRANDVCGKPQNDVAPEPGQMMFCLRQNETLQKEHLICHSVTPNALAVAWSSGARGGDSASIIVARAGIRAGNTSFDRLRSTSLGRCPTSLAVARRLHHCGRKGARTIFSRGAGGGVRKENLDLSVLLPPQAVPLPQRGRQETRTVWNIRHLSLLPVRVSARATHHLTACGQHHWGGAPHH